jgi:hypothetical protein
MDTSKHQILELPLIFFFPPDFDACELYAFPPPEGTSY